MIPRKSEAVILIFTALVLSIISVLTFQLIRSTRVHSSFAFSTIAREKAKMLALGGVNLAMTQLTMHLYNKTGLKKTDLKENEQGEELDKIFLSNLVPYLNKWQTFNLDRSIDGIKGEIKISISCEDGKFNINQLFDFKKNDFKPEVKNFFSKSQFNEKQSRLIKQIGAFLKKKGLPLEDISELLEDPEIKTDLFYQPPEKTKPSEIALMDLLTVWGNGKLEPWVLSNSVCSFLGLRRPAFGDSEKLEGAFSKSINTYSKNLGADWASNWDILTPIYKKRPPNLPELSKLLSQQFDPKVYTVISCGKVQDVEFKLLAVLITSGQGNNTKRLVFKNKKNINTKASLTLFRILKMYWL